MALYGGIFDPASFTLSQSYYYGSINNNPAHRAVVTEGDCIDLRADLDAGALNKEGAPAPVSGDPNWWYYENEKTKPPKEKVTAGLCVAPER